MALAGLKLVAEWAQLVARRLACAELTCARARSQVSLSNTLRSKGALYLESASRYSAGLYCAHCSPVSRTEFYFCAQQAPKLAAAGAA